MSEEACDWCQLDHKPCPGYAIHCARGEHCTTTDASCAASSRQDDHPSTCEDCGAKL